jgi:hypothetical protein
LKINAIFSLLLCVYIFVSFGPRVYIGLRNKWYTFSHNFYLFFTLVLKTLVNCHITICIYICEIIILFIFNYSPEKKKKSCGIYFYSHKHNLYVYIQKNKNKKQRRKRRKIFKTCVALGYEVTCPVVGVENVSA